MTIAGGGETFARGRSARVRRPRFGIGAMAVPATLYFAAGLGLPLVLLLVRSVQGESGLTLVNYIVFLSDAHNLRVLTNTLLFGFAVTAISFAVGFPYACAMMRAGAAARALLMLGLFLPMTTSVIVKAFGWTILLRRNGIINEALVALGVLVEPVRLLFTTTGLYLGAASILLPYMVLPIFAALQQIGPEIEEAAATLGAPPREVLRWVILPLTLAGTITGVSFVFSMTVSAYVIPSLLAGAGYPVLSQMVATAFLVVDAQDRGATVSMLLLVIAGGVVWAGNRLSHRVDHAR